MKGIALDNDQDRFEAEVMAELEEAMSQPEYKSFELMFNQIFGEDSDRQEDRS